MEEFIKILPFIAVCVVVFFVTRYVPKDGKSCGWAPDAKLVALLEEQAQERHAAREAEKLK